MLKIQTGIGLSGSTSAVAAVIMIKMHQRNRADSVAEEPTYESEAEDQKIKMVVKVKKMIAAIAHQLAATTTPTMMMKDGKNNVASYIPKPNRFVNIPPDVQKSSYFRSVELKHGNQIELIFQTPIHAKKLLMLSITESCVEQVYVHQTYGITNAFPLFNKKVSKWFAHFL